MPSNARELAATEEGLASLNGLLFYPTDPSMRFLVTPAMLYIAAVEGEGRTFRELFDYLEKVRLGGSLLIIRLPDDLNLSHLIIFPHILTMTHPPTPQFIPSARNRYNHCVRAKRNVPHGKAANGRGQVRSGVRRPYPSLRPLCDAPRILILFYGEK